MATLQLKNITKQFGDTKVIKGIDLDVMNKYGRYPQEGVNENKK